LGEDGTVTVKGSGGSVYYPPPLYPPPGEPPEQWPPPDYGESEPPSSGESAEDDTGEVAEEADPEARTEPEQAEAVSGEVAARVEVSTPSKGRSAESEGEVEPAVAQVGEGLTLDANEPEVATAEMVEPVEMESVEAVGPIGLGAEELVEMVSGRVAEEGEVAAREVDDPSVGGEQVVEIPDLLAPELDRKGDDRPVPGPGDVEFRVEVAPVEELVDAEPIAEVVEVDSVTGLKSDELGGVLAGRDATIAAEEAGEGIVGRVEADGSGLGEEVPELKWGTEVGAGAEASVAGGVLEPEPGGKVIPDVEPEVVDFTVEVVPVEEAVTDFRVEVAEAGTLEIDEEAAGGLARVVEEPEDEPVGRYLTEEEPEEEEEIQP
jgi:hypothetical protein